MHPHSTRGGTRTHTGLLLLDFESSASAIPPLWPVVKHLSLRAGTRMSSGDETVRAGAGGGALNVPLSRHLMPAPGFGEEGLWPSCVGRQGTWGGATWAGASL